MWYSAIVVIIAFAIAFIGFSGYSLAKNNSNPVLNKLSRAELNNKLVQLSKTPAIENNPVGAMCYEMATPPVSVRYICPVCGEVTLYDPTDNINKLSKYRHLVKKIKKIDVKLDESQFCIKCNPNIASPKYCLLVKYAKSNKTHKTCGITENDLILIYEYSEGIKEHDNGNVKMLLINYKSRLEKLLGTSIHNFGE